MNQDTKNKLTAYLDEILREEIQQGAGQGERVALYHALAEIKSIVGVWAAQRYDESEK